MLVEALMTRSVTTVAPTRSTRSAALLMRQRRFRHLPVVAGHRLVGIISDRDLHGPSRPVGEVMHREVATVTADTPVEVAAALMADRKIGALPVLDDGAGMIGIVTESDLMRCLARMLGGDAGNSRLEVLLRNLPDDLATIAAVARDMGVPIVSIVSEPPEVQGAEGRTLVLRVGTIQGLAFARALATAGIAVLSPPLAGNGRGA